MAKTAAIGVKAQKDTVNMLLRLPAPLHSKLVKRANTERRSLNSSMLLAIENYVK